MDETMIKIEHVTKEYRLGAIGGTTLRNDLQRLGAKLLHKEDPTLKIGQKRGDYNEKFRALDDVSLEIKKGEAIGIIGHNGAGKSTLLKLLCRVTAPTEGMISFNGRIASMLEVGTGFHPELTGRENIYMNGAILGMTRAEIDRKFDEIVAFSEIDQFIDTPVKRYSSGMYVKLAFSVAAHLDSEIMIMDEVLAVGDMAFQGKCIKKMRDIANSGKTVLYVSHNMNTIRQLCDKCIVLNRGKIIFDGDVEKAIEYYINASMRKGTRFDLTLAEKNTDTNSEIEMLNLVLENKDLNMYHTDETIDCILHVNSPKQYKNLKLMMVILRKDHVRIGMTESNIFDLCKGESDISFSFKCNGLVDGNYFAEVSIIANDDGQFYKYAGIYDAFDFVVINEEPLRLNREWRQDIFGNIAFPMITTKAKRR